MSIDGGKTWTALSSTTQTKTTVTALPVGTNVMFRFRALTPGPGRLEPAPGHPREIRQEM